MLNLIVDYGNGVTSLPRLASRLDTLRSSLLFIDPDWNERFERNWTKIEIANAVSLDRGSKQVVHEQKEALQSGINGLLSLFGDTFDPLDDSET